MRYKIGNIDSSLFNLFDKVVNWHLDAELISTSRAFFKNLLFTSLWLLLHNMSLFSFHGILSFLFLTLNLFLDTLFNLFFNFVLHLMRILWTLLIWLNTFDVDLNDLVISHVLDRFFYWWVLTTEFVQNMWAHLRILLCHLFLDNIALRFRVSCGSLFFEIEWWNLIRIQKSFRKLFEFLTNLLFDNLSFCHSPLTLSLHPNKLMFNLRKRLNNFIDNLLGLTMETLSH